MARTRQTIERAFALLKGRFRRLKYLHMARVDLIPATILACCVLHNICLNYEDDDLENYIAIDVTINKQYRQYENMQNLDDEGVAKRNYIGASLYQRR